MRFHLAKIIASSLFLASLQGCGSASFGGSEDKKKTASRDKSTAGSDDEEDLASEPAQVAGAFLTCEVTDDDAAKTEVGLGCVMKKPDGKKASMDGLELEANVVDAKGKKTKVPFFPEPEASDYTLTTRVPREAFENGDFELVGKQGGTAKMRRKAAMKSMKTKLKEKLAGSSEPVGSGSGDDETSGAGIPTSQGVISEIAAKSSELIGSLCNKLGEIVDGTVVKQSTTYSDDVFTGPKALCFRPFISPAKSAEAFTGYGKYELAHPIAGGVCLLVSVDGAIQILEAGKNPGLTLENLRNFAAGHVCPDDPAAGATDQGAGDGGGVDMLKDGLGEAFEGIIGPEAD